MIKLSVGAVTFYNPTDEVVNMKKYALEAFHAAIEQKEEVLVFYPAFTHRSLWIELAVITKPKGKAGTKLTGKGVEYMSRNGKQATNKQPKSNQKVTINQ